MDSIHFSRFTRPTGLVGRLIIPRAYLIVAVLTIMYLYITF